MGSGPGALPHLTEDFGMVMQQDFWKTVRLPERRCRPLPILYAMNATDPVRWWNEYTEDLPNSTDMSVKEAET